VTQQVASLLPSINETLLVLADAAKLSQELRLEYLAWLDIKESARFCRIKNQHSADSFLISRAIVKKIIADFFGGTPDQVSLTISSNGKPWLAIEQSVANFSITSAIHFSITHKLTAVAIAFAELPIGVDIEPISKDDKLKVARRFFTTQETERLQSLSPAARRDQFTRIWVLKEAQVKREGSTLGGRIGKVGFNVDGESIQCHGDSDSGYYQLYRLNINQRSGYLGIAGPADYGKKLNCYYGLPFDGYHRQHLSLVAHSWAALS
jgi:phosphopantetheinyl transferase